MSPTKKKPNKVHRKVAWGAAAGALSVVIVWIVTLLGVDVPAEVAQAFTVLLTFGTGYLK